MRHALAALSTALAANLLCQSALATPAPSAYDARRCVNLGNALDAPGDGSWGGRAMTGEDLERIAAAGFDTIRLPVRWSDHAAATAPYTIAPQFLSRVAAQVDGALALGLNVVLNVHHYEEIMDDPPAHGPRLLGLWRQIGEHFADRPDSLWFETLNEPFGALEGPYLLKLQHALVRTIRSSNPERVLILMGEEWSSIRSLPSNIPPPDPNVVYSFHYYDPFDFTHQHAGWLGDAAPKGTRSWGSKEDRRELADAARTAARFARKVGHPVFLGEFGVNDPVPDADRVRYLSAVARAFEERGVAWCLWSYANTFALYTDEDGWDEEVLQALGMPEGEGPSPEAN